MAKEIQIFCTLGPKTLNKKFLNNIKGKVSLLRINLSHVSLNKLKQNIDLIKKYTRDAFILQTKVCPFADAKVFREKLETSF